MISFIKDLFNYRELLKNNIKKEIRGKYKGAWLGVLWSYLNPLLMLAVYSIVFSKIMRIDIPNYTVFLFTALVPWNFFTMTVSQSSFSIVANGNILKKVYFPREIIPFSVVSSNLINFLISCLILVVFLLAGGVGISWYILYFPLILLIQYILLIGISFVTSALTVYIRDLEHIISIGLMVLFYGTPIVYSMDMVPSSLKMILSINPMTAIINAYRDILFYQVTPNIKALGTLAVISGFLLIIGLFIFRKLQKGFAEEL